MAAENNCTVRLLRPLPVKAMKKVHAWLLEHEFAAEWDDKFELEAPELLCEGVLMLHARNVAYEEPDKLIKLAKKFGFSVTVHTEWTSIGENDVTSNIVFFDVLDGRSGDIPATNDTRQPLVTLVDAIKAADERRPNIIRNKYCLPMGLDR